MPAPAAVRVPQRPAPPVDGELPTQAPAGSSDALGDLWALAAFAAAGRWPAEACLAAALELGLLAGVAGGPAVEEELQTEALYARLRRLCGPLQCGVMQLCADSARRCRDAAVKWQQKQQPRRFLPTAVLVCRAGWLCHGGLKRLPCCGQGMHARQTARIIS